VEELKIHFGEVDNPQFRSGVLYLEDISALADSINHINGTLKDLTIDLALLKLSGENGLNGIGNLANSLKELKGLHIYIKWI